MIKRYYATKDNTISNAFEENLTTRATGSNMGASDILETFSIYNQVSNSSGISSELARILIEFDTAHLTNDRTAGKLPASGSVSWYLKMFNAPHSQTVPSDFNIEVLGVSASWEEGYGIDMDYYEDLTRDVIGSNWIRRAGTTAWTTPGGDYHAAPTFTQTLETGLEDMELDVSDLVEQWLAGTKDNYGFGIKLPTATEGLAKSFYTKKFFGRDSEFFFQRPVLEARWDSARQDDRGYFYASSSLASATDNLNTLYLYNRIRGRLRDIPTTPTSASLRSSRTGSNLYTSAVTRESTGIYKADLFLDTAETKLYDVWWTSGSTGITAYHTGAIDVKSFESSGYNPEDTFVLSMPSLRDEYRKSQTHRLNLYVREKNWSPNIYTQAVRTAIPSLIIPSASFQLRRGIDDYIVVSYGTGSNMHTGLSYDVSGNYFDLDTTYLEAGYLYDIQYSFYDEENGWEEQPYRFKFRVVD